MCSLGLRSASRESIVSSEKSSECLDCRVLRVEKREAPCRALRAGGYMEVEDGMQ